MKQLLALGFDKNFELIDFHGPYSDYETAWNMGIIENDDVTYCVPVNIDDYFEGLEDYLSDAMRQVTEEE